MPSSNPRYADYPARSALRKRMASQPQRCWMCGLPISPAYPARHPYALELDELVPISKGGSAVDPANVRAAHRRSPAEFVLFARSAAKGAKAAPRKTAGMPTSRRW